MAESSGTIFRGSPEGIPTHTASASLQKMADTDSTPAWLTYAPLNGSVVAALDDSGRLQDLFACRETGQFFTAVEMHIDIEQRSSRSAKQLFCPCCPKSALKVESQKGDVTMVCPDCGWDARRTGVTSVSELLQRDGEPFPWISEEVRGITRYIQQQNERNEVDGNDGDPIHHWKSPALRDGVPPTTSIKRLRGKRQSLLHIERQPLYHELNKEESAALCAQTFSREREEKERHVFASWLPPETWNSAKAATDRAMRSRPEPDLANLMGDIDLADVVGRDGRVCSTTWLRRDCAARRRVPMPRVTVLSPFGGRRAAIPAEQIIPRLTVFAEDGCQRGGGERNMVTVHVANTAGLGELAVRVANAGAGPETAASSIPSGGEEVLRLSPLSWQECGVGVAWGDWSLCARLAVLDVTLQYADREVDDGRIGASPDANVWRVRVYARHLRRA